MSQRQAAKVLGVDQKTISNDVRKHSSKSEEKVRTGSVATKAHRAKTAAAAKASRDMTKNVSKSDNKVVTGSAANRCVWKTPRPRQLRLDRCRRPTRQGGMTDDVDLSLPLPSVFDAHGVDRLLERLRAVHRRPRQDIAPEISRASRAALRMQRAARALLPAAR